VTALAILRQLPSLFRYSDIRKFTTNANVFLTRALAKGLVERVMKGVYLNLLRENRPVLEEVACFLRTPSYISCEWALNRHGILLQAPTVCTVLTLCTSVGASRNLSYAGMTPNRFTPVHWLRNEGALQPCLAGKGALGCDPSTQDCSLPGRIRNRPAGPGSHDAVGGDLSASDPEIGGDGKITKGSHGCMKIILPGRLI